MPIPFYNLHDQTAEELAQDLIRQIPATTPEWRNPRPGDPGRTLIDLFAWMGDKLLYRVNLLPERQRLVIVGYFLQERTSQELARFLGVTESRVSQMRTEALETLRKGIQAQYEQDNAEAPEGRQAKRRANYADAIGRRQEFGDRISTTGGLDDSSVLERLMAAV